jgi:hypothetical protein
MHAILEFVHAPWLHGCGRQCDASQLLCVAWADWLEHTWIGQQAYIGHDAALPARHLQGCRNKH